MYMPRRPLVTEDPANFGMLLALFDNRDITESCRLVV